MAWLTGEKMATVGLAEESPITDGNLAAQGDDMRPALNSHDLEWVVVHVHATL